MGLTHSNSQLLEMGWGRGEVKPGEKRECQVRCVLLAIFFSFFSHPESFGKERGGKKGGVAWGKEGNECTAKGAFSVYMLLV